MVGCTPDGALPCVGVRVSVSGGPVGGAELRAGSLLVAVGARMRCGLGQGGPELLIICLHCTDLEPGEILGQQRPAIALSCLELKAQCDSESSHLESTGYFLAFLVLGVELRDLTDGQAVRP